MPRWTVRLRLTLLYGGLFIVSGALLLAITYFLFRRNSGPSLIVPTGIDLTPQMRHSIEAKFADITASHDSEMDQLLVQSGIALAIMTVVSIGLGWLVAGRVLRPLRAMTATTRQISERNLHQRLALAGPRDELRNLADTIDGLLARLEAHVAEQQRFAANASHELRTPLALTQTLLDVARADPSRDNGELVERLSAVNSRAIDLTEAMLLLSRTDQRSFSREPVDLSLLAEEATETLLPLAEKHGVTIEAAAEPATTNGSRALLLQLTTNLVHNAIVHNLPAHGTVWVKTGIRSSGAVLTVENTGEKLTPQLVSRLEEPFLRGSERARTDHAGVGLGLAIARSITAAHDGTLTLTSRADGGLGVTVELAAA
ncbi:MAG TPA: HAMP domain-containing sensor histidine kinase [Solirubrobacterales bacterium]|nr:HAMP domain-containing sensor histidine kinase [Solirubrobacterales bacterium]